MLSGAPDAVQRAKQAILQLIDRPISISTMSVAAEKAGLVIGREGSSIKQVSLKSKRSFSLKASRI